MPRSRVDTLEAFNEAVEAPLTNAEGGPKCPFGRLLSMFDSHVNATWRLYTNADSVLGTWWRRPTHENPESARDDIRHVPVDVAQRTCPNVRVSQTYMSAAAVLHSFNAVAAGFLGLMASCCLVTVQIHQRVLNSVRLQARLHTNVCVFNLQHADD